MDTALTLGGNNISTGPAARQVLDAKKAINNVFPGTFKNVAEAETVDKLNAQLASAAAKAMTARPSQLEFKAFMANNPGLTTTKDGSKILLDIMRQTKQQDIALSQLAQTITPGNMHQWTDIENKFYRDHPLVNRTTGYPIDAKQAPDGRWVRPNPDGDGYVQVHRVR
jgi:hypothetical protein